MADEGTMSAATFVELTGLSDRRHRQLADKGYFPQPIQSRYQLRDSIKGIIRWYRELAEKRGAGLAQKREAKLDKENELLDLELGEKKEDLVSVSEMVSRLSPACVSMRQTILHSELDDDAKGEMIDALGRLLTDAIKRPVSKGSPVSTPDTDSAAEADSQQVG